MISIGLQCYPPSTLSYLLHPCPTVCITIFMVVLSSILFFSHKIITDIFFCSVDRVDSLKSFVCNLVFRHNKIYTDMEKEEMLLNKPALSNEI